ncbi:MAG: CarD family transcriptional regulator [Rickettsiales bacterium]|nr:CarD family transcriptional regulator [Rickettsiales bacterium]
MKKKQDLFKVGDNVVYPSHGVGKIIKVEKQEVGGFSLKLLVIHLDKEKLFIRIPVNKAQKVGIRLIISNKDMNKVMKILGEKPKSHRGIWSKRAAEYEAKINSGDLLLIAEVIRDLYKDSSAMDRSYSEKVIYDLALNRLASEYALLHKMDKEKALEKILDFIKEKQTV